MVGGSSAVVGGVNIRENGRGRVIESGKGVIGGRGSKFWKKR